MAVSEDRQRRAREGLLAGQTIARAAESAGVGERTVARWLTNPEFRQRLDDARVDQSQRVATWLASAATAAVNTLLTVMADEDTHVSVKVSAARVILSSGPPWMDHAVTNLRIAAVEQELARRQPANLRAVPS